MITAQNINVYIEGKTILDDVTCEVRPGITCILGPNGAGKSTLLKCLSGGLSPNSGQVLLDQKSLLQLSTKELAKRRAVLGQNLDIAFPFKAIDIVMMGRSPYIVGTETPYDHDIADEALRAMDAFDLKDRIYNTLSGGEKQRVQIARVLTQIDFTEENLSDKYLFLDEPISALDVKYQKLLRDVLLDLVKKNLSIFCIVHDVNFACDIADHVFMMKRGMIVISHSMNKEKSLSEIDLKEVYEVTPYKIYNKQTKRNYYWF